MEKYYRKFFVIAVLLGLSVLPSFAEDSEPQQFQGFNLSGYGDGGQKTWNVEGSRADVVGDTIKLTDVNARDYSQDPMNLTAQSGILNKASGDMHLEKDVVVTTQSGAKMTTDSLDWHKTQDLVTTNDKVILTKEGMTAEGMGAIAHPNLKTAQLNQDVTVNVEAKPQKGMPQQPVTITCDGPLNVNYNEQHATFHNNVVAIQEDKKMTADQMDIDFDSQTKQIRQLVCAGNVVIIHGQDTTYAERAVYNAGDGTIILTGQPKLVFYSEEKGGGLPFGKMMQGK